MTEGKITSFPVQFPLNLERAKMLFAEESTILSNSGGVPLSRAVELFGKKAAEFPFACDGAKAAGIYSNAFGVGDYQCPYLTWKGFLEAVTYANVQWFAQREKQA